MLYFSKPLTKDIWKLNIHTHNIPMSHVSYSYHLLRQRARKRKMQLQLQELAFEMNILLNSSTKPDNDKSLRKTPASDTRLNGCMCVSCSTILEISFAGWSFRCCLQFVMDLFVEHGMTFSFSVCLSFCLSKVCLSVCLCLCLSRFLSLSLSLSLSPSFLAHFRTRLKNWTETPPPQEHNYRAQKTLDYVHLLLPQSQTQHQQSAMDTHTPSSPQPPKTGTKGGRT